jgi:sulfopyruvate decarboxylase alpha subunit
MSELEQRASTSTKSWPHRIHDILRQFEVRQVAYVPDGGHAELIDRAHGDSEMKAIPLTTEEEGVALLAGAWLGGQRAVLLLQSSGAGNCVNMLSLIKTCKFPFLALITMRGEWGEFNPWQGPMGAATQGALELMDVRVLRVERPEDIDESITAAARAAFLGGTAVAVLLGQRLIGTKVFVK